MLTPSNSHSEVQTVGNKGDPDAHSTMDLEGSQAEHARLTKATIRQVDFRLLPILGILYAFAVVDRANLGLARTAGMQHDLRLDIGNRYSIISCIFFIPYILFQLPSNLLLRKLGVTNWLGFCVLSWGCVQLSMGFVPSWKYLGLCRVLLGAFEAGFFPALVYIITTWYTRHEVQKRLAAFYLISVVVGGFSAILAYAITFLNGRYGIAGWAWIFIIEGALTIFFGCVAWAFLPNFPDQNRFLTPAQTALVLERVESDRGDSVPDSFTVQKVLGHLSDWTIWAYGLMFLCVTMPAYAISYFITLILRGMGWSVANSLLLSAPPSIFTAVCIMFFAWLSDKYCQRALVIGIQTCITILGMSLTGFAAQPGWRYTGLFLANAGSGGCIPGILAYASNNVVSHTKRAVSTAVIVSFGGIGGILATTVFRQADAPSYLPGIYATIACQVLLLMLLATTTTYFWVQNKRLRRESLMKGQEEQGFLYTL